MAAIPFTWRVWADANTIKIIVFSYSITTPTITLNGNAPDSTIAGTTGTNGLGGASDSWDLSTPALYTWIATWAGLAKATKHPLSVTQDAFTRLANPNTLIGPADTDAFNIYGITCDRAKAKGSIKGCYGDIRADATNNIGLMVMLDDYGYTDFLQIAQADGGSRWKAYNSNASGSFNTYGRVVGYAAFLGLTDAITPDVDGPFTASTTFFHDVDRIWCNENLPLIASPGDHEFINDPEGNPNLNAVQRDLSAQAWDETLGALQSYINIANSHATRDVVGPCEIFTTDGVFSLVPLTKVYDKAAQTVDTGVWIGAQQIADISNATDSTSPFKIMGMGHIGSKYFMDRATRLAHMAETPPWEANLLGMQEPLHDYTLVGGDSEWLQLISDKTTGIFKNNSQAYAPVIIALKGNLHHPYEIYHYYPGDVTHVTVNMYEMCVGSVSANNSQQLHPKIKDGYGYNGATQLWNPLWTNRVPYGDAPGDPDAPVGYIANTRATYIRMEFSFNNGWSADMKYIEVPHDQTTGLTTGPAEIVRTTRLEHGHSNSPPIRKGFV